MKKLFVVPFLALAMGACSESPTSTLAGSSPHFELVDASLRVAADDVNAHVYGTFSINFGGGSSGVITSGPANFPGNPKNAGTCDNGLWINSQGKRTAGSLDKPHPHCVGESSEAIQVVLEPISAKHGNPGQSTNEYLQFTADREDGQVKKVGGGGPHEPNTQGDGIIEAYAIDVDSGVRVGIFSIDLNQFDANQTNYFESDCTIAGGTAPRCLDLVIEADYEPLSVGGVGIATNNVTGFLYWTPATQPYNYDDD